MLLPVFLRLRFLIELLVPLSDSRVCVPGGFVTGTLDLILGILLIVITALRPDVPTTATDFPTHGFNVFVFKSETVADSESLGLGLAWIGGGFFRDIRASPASDLELGSFDSLTDLNLLSFFFGSVLPQCLLL